MDSELPRVIFSIEGERVLQCSCADFQRRLTRFGEGFCIHLVAVFCADEAADGNVRDPLADKWR